MAASFFLVKKQFQIPVLCYRFFQVPVTIFIIVTIFCIITDCPDKSIFHSNKYQCLTGLFPHNNFSLTMLS